MNKVCYVDIHVIQTVPPSNLNRDDAGTPKQALYGGVRRARVSSQAWKRAARVAFAEEIPRDARGTRTKKIASLFSSRLAERTGLSTEAADTLSEYVLSPLGIKPGKKSGDTAYLLFFGRQQLDRLVDLVADRAAELAQLDKAALEREVSSLPVQETLGTGHPLDVALFGRMVADIPALNVDAATQVAHAISTHPVEIEFDYFTAVDDENPRAETGAGMIGTVEFDSATLYRFATVGLHQLLENLDGDVDQSLLALQLFLNAFVYSMPGGHQTTFAHRTLPHLVCVVVRDDQPVNLVSAFESPVYSNSGMVVESMHRMAQELQRCADLWGATPVQTLATYAPCQNHDTDALLRGAFGDSLAFSDVVERTAACALDVISRGVA